MIEHKILLETDKNQITRLGVLELPYRLHPGDWFYWHIEGTSTVVTVADIMISVDLIGDEHVATGRIVATVKLKKGA